MPEGVNLEHVTELLRWASLDRNGVGVGKLSVILQTRFSSLLSVLEACKMLELASTSDGILTTTQLGEEFVRRPELLRDQLTRIFHCRIIIGEENGDRIIRYC
ncbi:MAG: hypothetical protein ACYC7D_10350 [Nitrososphaerales archaeon]